MNCGDDRPTLCTIKEAKTIAIRLQMANAEIANSLGRSVAFTGATMSDGPIFALELKVQRRDAEIGKLKDVMDNRSDGGPSTRDQDRRQRHSRESGDNWVDGSHRGSDKKRCDYDRSRNYDRSKDYDYGRDRDGVYHHNGSYRGPRDNRENDCDNSNVGNDRGSRLSHDDNGPDRSHGNDERNRRGNRQQQGPNDNFDMDAFCASFHREGAKLPRKQQPIGHVDLGTIFVGKKNLRTK